MKRSFNSPSNTLFLIFKTVAVYSSGAPAGYAPSPLSPHPFFPFNMADAAVLGSFPKDFLAGGLAMAITKTVVVPIKWVKLLLHV